MRIGTFVRIQAVSALGLVGLVGAALFLSVVQTNRAAADRRAAQEAMRAAFELSLLTHDYLLHPTERARQQWLSRQRSAGELLASDHLRDAATRPQAEELRRSFAATGDLFEAIAADVEGPDADTARSRERRDALVSRLLVEAQAVIGAVERLYRHEDRRLQEVRWRTNALTLGLVAAVGLLLAGNAVLLRRRVAAPVEDFQRGTQAVAAGELGATVRVRSFDEIEELARSFNRMAAELSSSRAALEGEIEQRREAEEALARHTRELEQTNRNLQEFAYVASHDLQEPLRKIQAFGDRLRSGYLDCLGAEGGDYLGRMLRAAQRMRLLIDSLLTYSRVSTHPEPFARVDLTELAREAADSLELRRQETGGTLEIGSLSVVEASPLQMEQLLQNLLGNALKFHRPGVPPVVRVFGRTARGADGRERAEIVVEDNGVGFEEKYRERIFGAFQRLHGRESYEGTGMGLAICRRIAERHGGTIEAESTPGEGSRFVVALPVRQEGGAEA